MKKYFYLIIGLLTIVITMLGFVLYDLFDEPCPPTAYFPCLRISDSTANAWLSARTKDSSKPYTQFVLNSYNSSSRGPWQLICYGQYDTVNYHDFYPLSTTPFPIYDTLSNPNFDSTNLAFGNLNFDTGALRKLISKPGNSLKLVPDVSTERFKHLTYRVYEGNFSITLGKFIKFDSLRDIFPPGGPTQVENDGQNDYILLNPCPPAHADE